MKKQIIKTDQAPSAIGTYSQAVKVGQTVYLSGQIPLDPRSMQLVSEDIREQTVQVFKNLSAVAKASGGSLDDLVKVNVYMLDLKHFSIINEVMATFVKEPYPARAAIGVAALPRGAQIEIEGIMVVAHS